MEETILVERHEGWWRITLNRPDRLNAFTEGMHRALMNALVDAEAGGCRALVLTGAGRAFCAGQDLNDRVAEPGRTPDLSATIEATWNPLVRKLRALPFPVIAAVNGTAAGAGANIALACDLVLAGRSAKFLQAFSKLGLIPDSGGTWFLPRLVGEARAKALVMLAEPLPAETAEAWGLIWRCVDDDKLLAEAEALAARLATQPTHGFALQKRAFAQSALNSLDAQLDLERDLQGEAGRTADYREGVAAFFERRPPRFTGRPA